MSLNPIPVARLQQVPGSIPPQQQANELETMYKLMQDVWPNEVRNDPANLARTMPLVMNALTTALGKNSYQIQPVFKAVFDNAYGELIQQGVISPSKLPLIQELTKRLAVAFTMQLDNIAVFDILHKDSMWNLVGGRIAEFNTRVQAFFK